MLCGLIRARPCIGPWAAATAVVQSHRQEGLHVGPWAAPFGRGVSNEPLLAPGGCLQTVEHRIHGLGQVGHFVARDRWGHPLGHLAAADPDPAAYSLERYQRATLCTGFELDRLGIRNPTKSACWLPTWFTSQPRINGTFFAHQGSQGFSATNVAQSCPSISRAQTQAATAAGKPRFVDAQDCVLDLLKAWHPRRGRGLADAGAHRGI